MSPAAPTVTIALPVRNGERFIDRAIDSVVGQSFEDLELVISDNCSTDRTEEICRQRANRDRRIRYFRNDPDIGVLRNFNNLVELAKGQYFRWLGVDDWLEPEYAAECVSALEANPRCIAVTTDQDHWDDAGNRFFLEYRGPRVDSNEPHERFARMLTFVAPGTMLIDPIFSMYHRETLASTQLHRLMPLCDRVLAAELSILGPYCHVPRCLAHRRLVYESRTDLDRRTRPPGQHQFDNSAWQRVRIMMGIVLDAHLTRYQTVYCGVASMKYYAKTLAHLMRTAVRPRLASVAKRLGMTRARLKGLLVLLPRRN